jgi:hypothetical protein
MIEATFLVVGRYIIVAEIVRRCVKPPNARSLEIAAHRAASVLTVNSFGSVLFPTEFSSGSIPISSCKSFFECRHAYPRYFRDRHALALATLSIIFIGLAHGNGWSGGPACSMAESLCRQPSLMAIPVLATVAWGLMLMTDR